MNAFNFAYPSLALLALIGVSCGSEPPAHTSTAPQKVETKHPTAPRRNQRGKTEYVPSAEPVSGLHSEPSTGAHRGVLRPSTGVVGSSVFEAAAPATVMVATLVGHGAGVIVDARGYVLTNYHVIAPGENQNFEFEATVHTIKVTKQGSVELSHKYQAQALKVDKKRDLALLKIVNPKQAFPSVRLAAGDPKPGLKVSAIGHAGVGFGWAIKGCSINGIGTLENSAMALFQRDSTAVPAAERTKFMETLKKAAQDAGLQVQTDCNVLPGDSGGPLLDDKTYELVGLNQSLKAARDGLFANLGTVAFHVHVAELRRFLKAIPEKPAQFLPDPWDTPGTLAITGDADHNGEADTFRISGECGPGFCHTVLVDVDEDSFKGIPKLPTAVEIRTKRAFNAELAVVERTRYPRNASSTRGASLTVDALYYFDSENKGYWDRVLIRDGETQEIRGYKMDSTHHMMRDQTLDKTEPSAALFRSAALRSRYSAFASVISPKEAPNHEPHKVAALSVTTFDYDGNGKADTAVAQTRLDRRVIADLDENDIPRLNPEQLLTALRDGTLDMEMIAISGSTFKVWYDVENDGTLDLSLEGPAHGEKIAWSAGQLQGQDRFSFRQQDVGRLSLRPGLVRDQQQAQRLAQIFVRSFGASAAVDDGLSSFPSLTNLSKSATYELVGNNLVDVTDLSRDLIFADLDGKPSRKLKMSSAITEAVVSGSFDPEYIHLDNGWLSWSFYDKNNDGKVETVLVSTSYDPLKGSYRFDIDAKGQVQASPLDDSQSIMDGKLFKKSPLTRAFGKVSKYVTDLYKQNKNHKGALGMLGLGGGKGSKEGDLGEE